jgi:hypothetical protein
LIGDISHQQNHAQPNHAVAHTVEPARADLAAARSKLDQSEAQVKVSQAS